MAESLTSWLNRNRFRRSLKEEMPGILAEYFAAGINEDKELACVTGLDLEELQKLRREYES